MNTIKIDQLIRSHRKTIGLQISVDARLIVRAPLFASDEYIQKLIRTKESWIRNKQDYFKNRKQEYSVKKFVPGEGFLFLGQYYPLIVKEDLPKAIVFDRSLMINQAVLPNARDHLEVWYKSEALGYISQRVGYFAQIAGLKYQSVRVNQARTRWGSCGYTDKLNFTWRLIMAPPMVLDYVVIHELMHIKQKNHSRRFWAEVAHLMPDYKQEERWLKHNGHLLNWA